MIQFVLLSSVLLTVTAQRPGMLFTTDEALTMMGIQLDENCIRTKISDYENTVSKLNCVSVKVAAASFDATNVQPLCGNKTLTKCSDLIEEKLGLCLNEALKNRLHYTSQSEEAILEYACTDGMNYLKAMANVEISKCSKGNNAEKCGQFVSNTEAVKPEDYYNEEYCKKRIAIPNCMLDIFNSCEDKAVYKFLKKITDIEFNITPCKEYVNEAYATFNQNTFTFLVPFLTIQLRNYFF